MAMAPTETRPTTSPVPDLAGALFLQVEQHDDEQEQHHHGARVNQDLHRREEEGVQQDEQSRPSR
jgi:hypothetical protein